MFRLFQPGDFGQLYAIEEICFQPPYRFSRTYIRKLTGSSRAATWIAELDGKMTGFAIVSFRTGADSPAAYVQTIEVLPGFRGKGIGAELLRRVESSALQSGALSIWLHVDTENQVAIGLYEAHGYIRRRREEQYYAHLRAAFIYSKPLSDPQLI
jgi:ribosomal protein S18 acetylase RimI-like enzyme